MPERLVPKKSKVCLNIKTESRVKILSIKQPLLKLFHSGQRIHLQLAFCAMSPLTYQDSKVSTDVSGGQQSVHWRIRRTAKCPLKYQEDSKVSTDISGGQQSVHWRIRRTAKSPLTYQEDSNVSTDVSGGQQSVQLRIRRTAKCPVTYQEDSKVFTDVSGGQQSVHWLIRRAAKCPLTYQEDSKLVTEVSGQEPSVLYACYLKGRVEECVLSLSTLYNTCADGHCSTLWKG
jgi:hypothetical protein